MKEGDSIAAGVGLDGFNYTPAEIFYDISPNFKGYPDSCYVSYVAEMLGLSPEHLTLTERTRIAQWSEEFGYGEDMVREFVTDINYNGYFLCVKHVSAVMAAETADGGDWLDIVQVNSKSGLQGSNKNGAYAGGKFGGIGLTQSFAMELVADRIKVNSVCPGNFFDGPLWSNPERGLFVQYLNSGKVPGAKTVADVKRFYEAKVPMNRGCYPADVAKAILYAVEQKYETGQAIPVTGGQVMLK